MSESLLEKDVLVADCQSSGATPAHGDLLELGWGLTTGTRESAPAEAEWVKRATNRPVSRAVRDLTGWDESAHASSIEPLDAWARLGAVARGSGHGGGEPIPTVIHFARFELPFLKQLHHASGGAEDAFPLDVVCLHTIACRLFPTLPRRNLRALAGHLGGSPEIVRRSKGHVEATGVVWRGVVPLLANEGVHTWSDLKAWLEAPSAPSSRVPRSKRQFPISSARRRALPDVPGVYRFLRPNGDVLYVGKAASLKRRVASHFTAAAGARATERALEMLTQAHDIEVTPVDTALEAALLETDEIKRLDPPYNVHLRQAERFAWFATRDWSHTASATDAQHVVGPLPSRFSISGIAAMRALLSGEPSSPRMRALAVGVPVAFGPEEAMFEEVWKAFAAEELAGETFAKRRILEASARIVPSERPEEDESAENQAPRGWDTTTIRRYLERVIVGEGTLVRRARALALLTDAHVILREPEGAVTRLLVIANGAIAEHRTVASDEVVPRPAAPPSLATRLAGFDAGRYDRLRVLATELRRIATQGGHVEVRVGRHVVGEDAARIGAILPARRVGYAP
jgi:DNA polymerase-3 subunit epsilon